jgi:hypothetical protein
LDDAMSAAFDYEQTSLNRIESHSRRRIEDDDRLMGAAPGCRWRRLVVVAICTQAARLIWCCGPVALKEILGDGLTNRLFIYAVKGVGFDAVWLGGQFPALADLAYASRCLRRAKEQRRCFARLRVAQPLDGWLQQTFNLRREIWLVSIAQQCHNRREGRQLLLIQPWAPEPSSDDDLELGNEAVERHDLRSGRRR